MIFVFPIAAAPNTAIETEIVAQSFRQQEIYSEKK